MKINKKSDLTSLIILSRSCLCIISSHWLLSLCCFLLDWNLLLLYIVCLLSLIRILDWVLLTFFRDRRSAWHKYFRILLLFEQLLYVVLVWHFPVVVIQKVLFGLLLDLPVISHFLAYFRLLQGECRLYNVSWQLSELSRLFPGNLERVSVLALTCRASFIGLIRLVFLLLLVISLILFIFLVSCSILSLRDRSVIGIFFSLMLTFNVIIVLEFLSPFSLVGIQSCLTELLPVGVIQVREVSVLWLLLLLTLTLFIIMILGIKLFARRWVRRVSRLIISHRLEHQSHLN